MKETSVIDKDAKLLEVVDASNTMELHKSNLMRLQVDELLSECSIHLADAKWALDAQSYIQNLTTVLNKLPSIESAKLQKQADKTVQVASLTSEKLIMEPFEFTKSPVAWTKPSGNAQMLPTFALMIKISSDVFSAKDYLNYRYFDKCTIVREKVAKHLVKHSKQLGSVTYQIGPDGPNAPYLQLVPPVVTSTDKKRKSTSSSSKRPKFQIHVHFGMETIDWIEPKLRLVPNRCNLKATSTSDEQQTYQAQMYNHDLLHQARHAFYDDELSTIRDNAALEKTLVLFQVWCLQRGLWRNHDGWSKADFGLLLVYLLRTNRMNVRMTPVQMMTIVLQFLVSTNWMGDTVDESKKKKIGEFVELRAAQNEVQHKLVVERRRTVLVLPSEGHAEKETVQKSKLAKLYQQQTKESPITDNDPATLLEAYSSTTTYQLGPVFLDPSMTYNYLGRVSPNYMQNLQLHAKQSLKYIQSKTAFGRMFLTPARFWHQWDLYVRIPVQSKEANSNWEESTRSLLHVLQRALTNRVRGMRVLSTGNGDLGMNASNTADSIPSFAISKASKLDVDFHQSPVGSESIVIGFAINAEASQRVVDRGPPSDQTEQVQDFLALWGSMAQLRRFKDGAIVQAVIWTEGGQNDFQNEDRLQGGIVQRVIRHIVRTHYTKQKVQFALPNLLSVIDGVKTTNKAEIPFVDPVSAHRNLMKVFESLSEFLKKNSQPPLPGRSDSNTLGLPLPIDGVEPLSPALRYSELFPPLPHPFLGGVSLGQKKVAGAITSDPILLQIRFGLSPKWPTDFKAMGAAKTAMLLQLSKGIETTSVPGFEGPSLVTPNYFEFGYKGYCFRIFVRADQELRVLQGLQTPSAEALFMLQSLQRKHVISSLHHSTIHAVHTLHPSASAVVRLARRWVAGHLLSTHISTEIIELLVAKVYSDNPSSPLGPPGSVATGFIQWLRLLSIHNWEKDPLIVDPRQHLNEDDEDLILSHFEKVRSSSFGNDERVPGPPMYLIAPYNRPVQNEDDDVDGESGGKSNTSTAIIRKNNKSQKNKKQAKIGHWNPSVESPEWVALHRVVALAKRSHDYLITKCLQAFDILPTQKSSTPSASWPSIFHQTATSFQAYNVLLRVDPEFIFDKTSSSTGGESLEVVPVQSSKDSAFGMESGYTRCIKARTLVGPKSLRRTCYRNLQNDDNNSVLTHWNPIDELVDKLKAEFGHLALFFFNELAPEVIGIVWRPNVVSESHRFSVMVSEYVVPVVTQNWESGTFVKKNCDDILRDMRQYFSKIVVNTKIMSRQMSKAEDKSPTSPANKSTVVAKKSPEGRKRSKSPKRRKQSN